MNHKVATCQAKLLHIADKMLLSVGRCVPVDPLGHVRWSSFALLRPHSVHRGVLVLWSVSLLSSRCRVANKFPCRHVGSGVSLELGHLSFWAKTSTLHVREAHDPVTIVSQVWSHSATTLSACWASNQTCTGASPGSLSRPFSCW